MNQYFNTTRLRKYVATYWFENRKALLLLFASIGAFLTIWLSFYYSFGSPNLFRPLNQVAYYFFGLVISGFLSASFLFADFRNKPRAISHLMIPASQLEKVICALFFGIFVFWAGYSLIFSAIDWMFVSLSNAKLRRTDEVINILTINKYQNPFLDNASSTLYYMYFGVHAMFAFGSVHFTRYAFFKTLIFLLIFWMIFFFIPPFLQGFMPPGAWISSLMVYEIYDYRENVTLELPAWFRISSYIYFCFGISVILWIATYFRFTERQIV